MDGSRIKELRKRNGISLTKLSQLTGISKSYLSCIERNQNNPSLDILERISTALEVDVNYFVMKNNLNDEANAKAPEKSVIKFEIEVSIEEMNVERYKELQKLITIFKK